MRFVAALLGLRAQDMKLGAPPHFHLRYRYGENVAYAGNVVRKAERQDSEKKMSYDKRIS
jgi:hypothetical protein